jgi:hypothetical protein
MRDYEKRKVENPEKKVEEAVGQRQGLWNMVPTLTGYRQFPMALQAQGREVQGLDSVSSCGSKISAQG